MQMTGLAVVVLAAGKGTRMKSPRAKVLHTLHRQPLLFYLLKTVQTLNPERLIVVAGFQAEEVRARFDEPGVEFVLQEEQLGTGHAVMQCRESLEGFAGDVLVLCGDMPLLKPRTLETLVCEHRESGAAGTLLVLQTEGRKDFGRIVRDGSGAISRIVEDRDASPAEKCIDEYNSGVYCFDSRLLFKALAGIDNNNAQNEYYLTDTIKYLVHAKYPLHSVLTHDADEILGINTEEDLKKAERLVGAAGPPA